jgi:hypothetical protein
MAEADGDDSFETGARRRQRITPQPRPPSKRADSPLRLVSLIRGSLALDEKDPARLDLGEGRQDHAQPKQECRAQVVPLRPDLTHSLPAAQPAARESEEVGTRAPPSQRGRDDTSSRTFPIPTRPKRPPVLASEALRKDLLPATPASRGGRFAVAALGLMGLIAALGVGGAGGMGVPFGGAFLALLALGVLPMSYGTRAAAIATVAGSGLTVVTWTELHAGRDVKPLVLMVGALLLSTALLFRSWHRGSLLARALVALGIALCTVWLWMSATLHQLLVLEGAWQQWLPPLLATPLPLLLLLSLLSFMDARSTGGSLAWATLLLTWYGLYTWCGLIELAWGADVGFDPSVIPGDIAITLIAEPLFGVAAAIGVAQLLAASHASE